MRFPDIVELENLCGFRFEHTSRRLIGDFLHRNIRNGKLRSTKDKTAKECEVDPAWHLKQRIESVDRIETASHPARHMRPPRRSIPKESMKVVLPTRSSTASIFLLSRRFFERSGVSISQRWAPSSLSTSNLSFLRVVAIIVAPTS